MKVVLVMLCNEKCRVNQTKLADQSKHIDIDEVICWDWNDFQETEYYKHPVFQNKRGLGFWSWKPCIILEAMKNIEEGDCILYHDAGRPCYNYSFNNNVKPYVEYIQKNHNGLGICFGPWKHKKMTKRDCFIEMNCDETEYLNSNQVSATYSFWTKNEYCINILNQWKDWCFHPSEIVTDKKSIHEEHKEYDAHRHDQSILTNILLSLKDFKIQRVRGWEKDINHILEQFPKDTQ